MMTRVEEIANKREGLFDRFLGWYSRRTFGMIIDPLRVLARNKVILAAAAAFDMISARSRSADHKLKELAQIKAATMIGCPW